jgi:hypothetical protein
MAARKANPGAWMPAFLAALRSGAAIKSAAREAGIAPSTTYYYRRRDARFATEWQTAQAPDDLPGQPGGVGRPAPPRHAGWRVAFFEVLVETSNVTVSAARAGVPLRTVYKTRRDDAGFAAKWRAALHEGYDNLEMELLGHLRAPNPARKMDVASSLRLLIAHRETVARERALREDDDEQAVLDSIDAFIEDMRQRRLANSTILLESEAADGED